MAISDEKRTEGMCISAEECLRPGACSRRPIRSRFPGLPVVMAMLERVEVVEVREVPEFSEIPQILEITEITVIS